MHACPRLHHKSCCWRSVRRHCWLPFKDKSAMKDKHPDFWISCCFLQEKRKLAWFQRLNYFVATPNSNIIQSRVNKDTLNIGLQSLWLNCKLSKQKTSLSSQTLSPFEPTETTNHKKEINICKGHMHYMQSNQNASLPNKLQGIARAAWRRQARASLHLLRSLAWIILWVTKGSQHPIHPYSIMAIIMLVCGMVNGVVPSTHHGP